MNLTHFFSLEQRKQAKRELMRKGHSESEAIRIVELIDSDAKKQLDENIKNFKGVS